jgi:AcrR family transcriptional regulator
MSRGGLYRHFGSTKEIFIAILNDDKDEMQYQLEQSILKKVPAESLFDYFLEQQKEFIMSKNSGLSMAIYEFAFAHPDQREYMNNRFEVAVKLFTMLLEYGQSDGQFKECDTKTVAINILVFLEGLKTSSTVLTMSEGLIDSQLQFIKDMVMRDGRTTI